MAELERTGVSLVVENANKAISDLTSFNKALGQTDKAATQVGKGGFKGLDISGVLSKNIPVLNKLNGAIGQFVPQLGQAASAANGLQGALAAGLTPAVLGTAAAFAAAAVAAVGFWKLGTRGAQLQPTINAFGNLVSPVMNATDALNNMREQTRGTVSDMGLMGLATSALAGTSREFRDAVVPDLGAIVDATNRVAQATGASAEVVREKFFRGLRLSSKLLVDDVGAVFTASEAYEAYAEKIGKSASALTEAEKKTAFATMAIEKLKGVVSEMGEPLTVLDALKIPFVALTNILDKLSLAVQPLFKPIVESISGVFSGIQSAFNLVLPYIAALFEMFGQMVTTFKQIGTAVFNFLFAPFLRLAGDIIPYVIAAFKLMVNGITTAVKIVGNIVSGVFNTFASVRDKIFGDTSASIEQLAFTLARGGGFIIGSFAAGLLNGGKYVVIAVTKIAQIVADFLQGFSPPKKGPLSDIDEGGENVAKSWIDGFKDQFLKPAAQVAEEVNKALGVIGTFTRQQVEGRLAALDEAIRPFVEQAKIAAAQFEAIAGFIDPALEALDRQRKIALEQFAQGKISAEQLRALDAQFAMLSEYKAEQQSVSDAAAIQLALAQAQQAEEKALLEIQLARLDATEETAAATEEALDAAKGGAASKPTKEKPIKEGTAAGDKAPTGGGAGEATTGEAAAAPFTGGAAPDLLSNAAIDRATEVLTSGFNKGLEDAGFGEALAGFESATGELGNQLERIATSDPVQGIVDKFAGLEEGVGTIVETFKNTIKGIETAIANVAQNVTVFLDVIKRAFDNVLGSEGVQRIVADVNMVIDQISERVALVALTVGTNLDTVKNAFADKIENGVTNIVKDLVGEEGLQKINTTLDEIGGTIDSKLEPIRTAFQSVFGGEEGGGITDILNHIVSPTGFFGENGSFIGAIDAVFAPGALLDQSLANAPTAFNQLATDIASALGNVALGFEDFVINGIPTALSGFAASLETNLIQPLERMLDKAIQTINDALPDQVGFGITIDIPTLNLGALGTIGGGSTSATINIDLPDNPLPNPFKAAKGGMGLKGLGIVGERGAELVNFGGGGADVIPANMTQRLIAAANAMGRSPNQARIDKILAKYGSGGLMGMMGSSQPIPMRSQANTASQTSIDRSRNIQATFNNTSQNDSILIMRQLEALG